MIERLAVAALAIALIGSHASAGEALSQPAVSQAQRERMITTYNPCTSDANGSACLRWRADRVDEQMAQLQHSVQVLSSRLDQLQQAVAKVDSVGDPGVGKADGYDDLWSAIRKVTKRLDALERP